MAEQPIVEPAESGEPAQGTPPANQTPPEQSEEVVRLEAERVALEEEIRGLEGTKQSLLDDVVRTRQEKRMAAGGDITPQVDVEALKAEIEESVLGKVTGEITSMKDELVKAKEQLVKAKESEITSKKALIASINARMASATAAKPSATPSSNAVENQVELSDDETRIAKELGLKNPRYMKETEVL